MTFRTLLPHFSTIFANICKHFQTMKIFMIFWFTKAKSSFDLTSSHNPSVTWKIKIRKTIAILIRKKTYLTWRSSRYRYAKVLVSTKYNIYVQKNSQLGIPIYKLYAAVAFHPCFPYLDSRVIGPVTRRRPQDLHVSRKLGTFFFVPKS